MVRRHTRHFIAKPDLVDTELIYPVTLTTDTITNFGFSVQAGLGGPFGQHLFRVYDKDENVIWTVPRAGGPSGIGFDQRAARSDSDAWIALSGSSNPPCLAFDDGNGNVVKLRSGTGPPSIDTIKDACVAGEFYLRRGVYAPCTLVAMSSTTTQAQGTLAIGTGTLSTSNTQKDKDGTPVAGDLLIVVQEGTDSSATLAVTGGDSGITAASGDGGASANDGTRYVRLWSRVIQAGDISSGQIVVTPSSHSSGAGRRLVAFIFHADSGSWATVGSKHGAALHGSDDDTLSGAGDQTLTVTGPAGPSVSVVAWRSSANSAAGGIDIRWDGGSTSNLDPDNGATQGTVGTGAKPGLGTNTSGAVGNIADGVTALLSNTGTGNKVALLGTWAVDSPGLDSDEWLYVCTSPGSPGTWEAV